MVIGCIAAAPAAGLLAHGGCFAGSDFYQNNTTLRTGTLELIFINTTRFRASFTFGSYDALDKTPGAAVVQQLRVEAQSTSAPQSVACRRNAVVGTTELIRRAVDADFEDDDAFDADAFVEVVNFSSAPADDPAAGQPTEGFARGINRLLGVDFDCRDRLFFTFVEDPDSPGGFRIDFSEIPNDDDDR